jgi:hypothetical protein
MVRDLDRNRDHIDAGLGHQLLVVCEHRADPNISPAAHADSALWALSARIW